MTPRARKVYVGCRAGHFEETVAFPFGRRRRQYAMEDMSMTSRLRFGVFLAPYHNPLWVAERIVLLDHLTRGRAMFGAGPGSLPTDGIMIGVSQSETRELLEQSLDVIMRLLTGDEPVTFKNHRWDLRDARLHLRPYSNPLFDVAVAAVASPTGAKLARRHGIGLLSVGATMAAGFDALALHWGILEEEAKAHGKTVDRSK